MTASTAPHNRLNEPHTLNPYAVQGAKWLTAQHPKMTDDYFVLFDRYRMTVSCAPLLPSSE